MTPEVRLALEGLAHGVHAWAWGLYFGSLLYIYFRLFPDLRRWLSDEPRSEQLSLTTGDGQAHGIARSEGARELAAVLWSSSARPRDVASIEERVARALARRREPLAPEAATDAVRLVHGAADGLPGLAVDRLGPLLRMLVTGRSALPLRERVLAALRSARLHGLDRDPPVIEVMHLRERPPGELACVRLIAGDAQLLEAPLVLHEGKLAHQRIKYGFEIVVMAPAING